MLLMQAQAGYVIEGDRLGVKQEEVLWSVAKYDCLPSPRGGYSPWLCHEGDLAPSHLHCH
jgi:hypothetical protein